MNKQTKTKKAASVSQSRSSKLLCLECGWVGTYHDILSAKNPFQKGEIIACPECKEIGHLSFVCEVDGCEKEATCGTPTKGGYLRCCGEHFRKLKA